MKTKCHLLERALQLHLDFLSSLPSGWLMNTSGDIGLLNDAYIASSKAGMKIPPRKPAIKFWILTVFGNVDPRGPYDSEAEMLKVAKRIYKKQREKDAIFWLRINDTGKPSVGSFSSADVGA